MAVDTDPENQAGSNEQTPLLGDRRASGAPPEELHEQTPLLDGQESAPRDEDAQAAQPELPPKKQRSRSWWLWRLFWTIVAVAILTVFIKGWIDADDVHVSD